MGFLSRSVERPGRARGLYILLYNFGSTCHHFVPCGLSSEGGVATAAVVIEVPPQPVSCCRSMAVSLALGLTCCCCCACWA